MVRLDDKDVWLCFPEFPDGFIWCFEPESLELLGKVVGYQPVTDVPRQLGDGRVVEGFDGRFLDGPHHAFGLAIGPGMVGFGQPMRDAILLGDTPEDVREDQTRAMLAGQTGRRCQSMARLGLALICVVAPSRWQ